MALDKPPYWRENFTKASRVPALLKKISHHYPDWPETNSIFYVADIGASVAITTLGLAEQFLKARCLAVDMAEHLAYPSTMQMMPPEWYKHILSYDLDYDNDRFNRNRERVQLLRADYYNLNLPEEFRKCDLVVCDNSLSFILVRVPEQERKEFLFSIVRNLSTCLNDGGVLAISNSLIKHYCFYIRRFGNAFTVKIWPGVGTETIELADDLQFRLNKLNSEN